MHIYFCFIEADNFPHIFKLRKHVKVFLMSRLTGLLRTHFRDELCKRHKMIQAGNQLLYDSMMDAKKKSHTSSELSIIECYLFRVRLTDYSSLHEWGTGTESHPQKRGQRCSTLAYIV